MNKDICSETLEMVIFYCLASTVSGKTNLEDNLVVSCGVIKEVFPTR